VEKLAIRGGRPAVNYKLPHFHDKSGRFIGEEELQQLSEVIESGKLSFLYGEKVKKFEKEFASLYSVERAVATSSGTAALHTAVTFVNPNPGDEIIVSPITDIGSIIPVLYQNAIPVFADVDPETHTVDPEDIERNITGKTKAILVTHIYGHPCDMDPIMELAEEKGLAVIEDCAQAYLAEYKGRKVGTIGHLGCFSLQQSKHMTSGDGGIVITNSDKKFGRELKLCADKGWPREKMLGGVKRDHLFLAPNYHMTELQGAVGLAQIKKLRKVVDNRRKMAKLFDDMIKEVSGLSPQKEKEWATHSYFFYPIHVDIEKFRVPLTELARAIRAEGIEVDPGYLPFPIYGYDMIRKKRTYGTSECPFSCPLYGRKINYPQGLCPRAEKACRETLVILAWNEKFTEQDLQAMTKGITKVADYYAR